MVKTRQGRPRGIHLPRQRAVRFDVDTDAALAKLANEKDISESELIRLCVRDVVRGHYIPLGLK
jgi:hypothetical protein